MFLNMFLSTYFRIINETTSKINRHVFIQYQSRCARKCENEYIYNLHEGSGPSPQGAKEILKNQLNGGFSFKVRLFKFIVYFLAGLPKSKKYELAPQLT